jgi:iron complex outermembrane receptor protein
MLVCLAMAMQVHAADQMSPETPISFDIPEQRADLALIEFAKQADQTLVFSFDVTKEKTSNRLFGKYTVMQGLQRLLAGSGLQISLGGEGQLSVIETAAGGATTATAGAGQESPGKDDGTLTANEAGQMGEVDDGFEEVLDEINVTARKRDERLQDVPSSVAALTRQTLENVGVLADLRDLTDLVTGITINDTQLASISEPSIRGAGGGRNRMSVSATGLYRNSAYFATSSLGGKNFARMDSYDLERAEVLRGPQGALYGRNALGGSINLISRKPSDDFGIDVTARAGELDFSGIDAVINTRVSEKAAVRISHVNERRRDGFYTDVNGDAVDDLEYDHTRLSVRYRPTDELDINYVFDTQSEMRPPTIRIRENQLATLGSEFNTYIDSPHFSTNDVDNHNLTVDWTVGNGVLTSVSNFRDRMFVMRQDGDFFNATDPFRDWQFLQSSDVSDIFFQELRYVSDAKDKFRWLLGADYFSSANDDLIDNTLANTVPTFQIRNTHLDQDSWALFVSADYTFDTVPITLSGEARYAVDDVVGALTLYRASDLTTPERDFSVRDRYTNLPFSATISYRFEDIGSMAYFKIASSYRQGGINDGPGDPNAKFEAKLTYEQEESVTYEFGWKSVLLDSALTFNFAAYYIFYDEFIAATDNGCPDECTLLDENGDPLGFNPDGTRIGEDLNGEPVPPNQEIPRTSFMDNVGDAEAWGMEAEMAYQKRFRNSGAALDFKLGWSRQLGEVKSLSEGVSDALQVRALGARLQYMRPEQWKTQLTFRQPLDRLSRLSGFSGASLFASATYVHESGGARVLDINNPNPMDTAQRLNARLGLRADRWSLILNARNLTDESYRIWENLDNDLYRRVDPRYVFAEFSFNLR